ncbi:hypothetical protein [Streptomyces fractus]|uniref:hypothetical protein n=1 Tax=Streptomyces fractus TaxID=641806 RepID=UPI003CEC0B7C
MRPEFHVTPRQVFWSCSPQTGARIRVTAVDGTVVHAVDHLVPTRRRRVPLDSLHPTPLTGAGARRRTGYALLDGRVETGPAVAHIAQLAEQRPDVPLSTIANLAHVPPSTLATLLADTRPGRRTSPEVAHRLLLVTAEALPAEPGAFGGAAVDATQAIRHVRALMQEHPRVSLATFARAASVRPTTLAAAFSDVMANRPRTIRASVAQRLLDLGHRTPVPDRPEPRRNTVDMAPVVEHIHALQARYDSASLTLIAKTAGVPASTLRVALDEFAVDPRRSVNSTIADKILALRTLPAPAIERRLNVTNEGIQRRLRALCAAGWRLRNIADAGGTGVKTLSTTLATGCSTPLARQAILTAWKVLSARPGPCDISRRRAAAKRWAPPLAWDEETIDDPRGRPHGVRRAS